MSARRWSKWWWQDWQRDPALRMCSLSARGAWMEMLCLMADAEPFGHLLVAGRVPNNRQLASVFGCSEKEAAKLLSEMEENGVFSRSEDGVIFSRRMVRDKAISDEASENGKKGGNPNITKEKKKGVKPSASKCGDEGLTPPDNHQARGGDKHQEAEAEADITLTTFVTPAEPSSQALAIPEPEIAAAPMAAGNGLRSPVGARSALWSIGATSLHHMTGKPPKACKSLIGKWLRDLRDDCASLNLILLEACETRPIDPESWIAGAVRARSGGREADRARRWNLNDIDLDAAAEADMRQMGMLP